MPIVMNDKKSISPLTLLCRGAVCQTLVTTKAIVYNLSWSMSSEHDLPAVRRYAATIRQVAEDAGVSTATVSRVFTGGTRVTDEVRQRVREAARRLNYQPNRL